MLPVTSPPPHLLHRRPTPSCPRWTHCSTPLGSRGGRGLLGCHWAARRPIPAGPAPGRYIRPSVAVVRFPSRPCGALAMPPRRRRSPQLPARLGRGFLGQASAQAPERVSACCGSSVGARGPVPSRVRRARACWPAPGVGVGAA